MHALTLVGLLFVAQVDGGVSDAPTVVALESGDYIVSKAAFEAVDSEMKRLQLVEIEHKAEAKGDVPWVKVVLVSALTGLVLGAVSGVLVDRAIQAKK